MSTAGISCIEVGIIQPFAEDSVAYARDMPAPQRFPSPVTNMMEPAKRPRVAAGEISALYAGTAFSTRPTALYAMMRPTVNWDQA